jgi:DNA (cytosine-5)-methyltransferase 1
LTASPLGAELIRAFDMFSGLGGSSRGAANAGAEILGGVDLCPLASQTFKINFPNAMVFNRAVEELSPSKVLNKVGDIDLLLASPECTNHSCARGARPTVESSRETALHVLRFAAVIRPRWIILENVIHMRPWSRYSELVDCLEEFGYDVAEHVLDAADFGVPQRRRRLFLLCDRRDVAPVVVKKRPGPKPAARTILDRPGTWTAGPLRNGRRAKATLLRAKRGMNALGKKAPFLLVYYGSDGAGGWQSLDVPLRTITTLDRFGLVEPSEQGHTLRMLQVSELSRAMGLDENHRLEHGSRRDRIRLLGNGVCPPVMEAAVSALCGNQNELSHSKVKREAIGLVSQPPGPQAVVAQVSSA